MSSIFKFYYDLMSQPSRALWISFKLGKTPFKDCPVALRKREQLTDEYKQINRFQKVPALVDGDFHLSESIAILRYLSDKGQFSEKLYPKNIKERARVDEFLEWQHLSVRMSCGYYFMQAWLLPINRLAPKPSAENIDKMIKNVESNLSLIERLWLDNDFLTGQQLTVADLFGATEIEQLKLCQYKVNEKKFPKVFKWLQRVRQESNPYFDEAHSFISVKSKQAALAKL
ncbi:glutathione S-transferase theta-3-like [Scaptodrosophila lebanonensis]|uniref:Glutathione S-transferase theta-3-like n=1 Tax=Drosophila lebanonensis TaxID=7225 RepID=A0A6J2TNY4_DROLE|nr:glutathione S-transferase theta-3-like [Scaptodrosophila lebanonensis]